MSSQLRASIFNINSSSVLANYCATVLLTHHPRSYQNKQRSLTAGEYDKL
ncbi:MAG: hypothetical protein QNJ33_11910 [Crocosphaera sp.]|nr:hypothetical protein [Crocosphaera sp.]